MRMTYLKAILKRAVQGATVLLLGAGVAGAQQQINLTAGPSTASMPDGSTVPMWGYSCGAIVTGSSATCAALNPKAGTSWSPVVITVPTGAAGGLTINLTNNLTFTPTGATTANTVPTSIMIVGQVGGGLGSTTARTTTPSPDHSSLSSNTVTWPTAGTAPSLVPPPQGPRVQSFSTEVAAGSTTALAWSYLKPGTYLLESGTHPSIQVPMGLYGILVVTAAPSATSGMETTAGTAYPGVTYDAEVPMAFGEIDPVQNTAVSNAVNTAGFTETAVWSGQPNGCGNPASSTYLTCYPPAVNYTPTFYTINGVPFNTANPSGSDFAVAPPTIAPPASTAGSVLVRMVNAGLRMHVPAIVGSQVSGATGGSNPIVTGFKVIAEDGNPLPGVPKIKSEVFMAAGKVYDVMINGQVTTTTAGTPPALPTITYSSYPNALAIYDRELSLSANKTQRDSGMLAYISINGASLPAFPTTTAGAAGAAAVNDAYILAPGQTLTVSDPGKGVIANDRGVFLVQLLAPPTNGTVTMNPNGTFAYYPNEGTAATTDTFTYCANGEVKGGVCSSGISATVSLGPTTITGGITCTAPPTYTAAMATYLAIKTPGVLAYCKDSSNLPLTLNTSATTSVTSGMTLNADGNGGFTAATSGSGTYSATLTVQNTNQQTANVTIKIVFPAGSGLTVNVLDGQDKTTQISDYRWVIEEDRTFYVNPNCSTNPPPAGCPTASLGIVPTLGTNFHTSYMPYVAQGCTGPVSCESGQTVLNQPAVCDVGNGACRTTGTQLTQVMPGSVALDPTKRYYISILPGDAANPFENGGFAGGACQTGVANAGGAPCGHGMGGAPIAAGQTAVTVITQPTPLPPGKLSVFVFEDDFPLNGEQDGGGGVDVLSPQEPGLGGFQLHLWDAMGGNGDFTGQMTYDMFNQPLTNSLAGTKDPNNGNDACPVGVNELTATSAASPKTLSTPGSDPTATGITGMIVTCPKYESDGVTLSPLAGQAVVANLMPGRWGVIATPGADRIARGEEWLQTNTLDGQKAHDVFTRVGEPSYFQEFGPASYHVSIGFANPAIIQARQKYLCNGTDPVSPQPSAPYTCNNTITGIVTGEHLSRTPDERLYSTGSHDTYYWTQCYVSFGDPDGEDFAFTKCNGDGTFTLSGLPAGDWRVTVFDQWNDLLVDGLSTPIGIAQIPGAPTSLSESGTTVTVTVKSTAGMAVGQQVTIVGEPNGYNGTFTVTGVPSSTTFTYTASTSGLKAATGSATGLAGIATTVNMHDVASTQWETDLYTRTCIDANGDGICEKDDDGISFANVAVRLRDGSLENLLVSDFTGTANFNETFPLFSWYTVETDVTRYKNTGTHVVYDVGGPVDGSASCGTTGYPPCGTSTIAKNLANTAEIVSVPTNLRIPGSVYCKDADCSGKSIQNGPGTSDAPSVCTTAAGTPPTTTCSTQLSSGRIDGPWSGGVEGWQGFPGQNSFLEFGKEPYIAGENGGIKGHVVYASTRPFDDPQLLVQTQWEPLVPHVTINLYQEGFASDGVTPTLKLVDTTKTSSWDDYAQGFHTLADGKTVVPNMNCPGQGGSSGAIPDLFYFSIYNQPNYLDFYSSQHGGAAPTALPDNSQFKCYDGMHNWNQLQPAPYDGMYKFPSVTSVDPTTGIPNGTNCTICSPDPVPSPDLYAGVPMLPVGKYVVEVVLPPGYELVKEEDKNILIGDDFIAPVTQEFGGLGNIFIIPDQASVASGYAGPGFNANNQQNPTVSLGTSPSNNIVPGFIPEPTWPCVGEARIVPDYISLFPQSKQVAPFAGATRNLCDRKEVTLNDQMGAIAKFYIYTSTHIASKFTGGITDDYTSEFDPFSPQFGEKFAPPDLPVSVKDWAGNEISRVYADHWGAYDGMTYSTWEVNPPNPTGYSPTMMVVCMNDPGPIPGPNGTLITDPAYTIGYSQFCYELPFMPGTTQYLDTPVVPTSAFAGAGYNNVDCAYPTLTPAIAEVDGDGVGPWVSAALHTLTITALGDQVVPNYAYSGPAATTAPFNQKTITRHYGFGATQGSGTVTIGGLNAPVTGWNDTSITVTVPPGVANCPVQQQAQYGGSAAQCGQLVITAGNGKQSIDAVTVTIGGKAPTHVSASQTIQAAIDAAAPGDLIIVDPTCSTATASGVACSTTGVTVKTNATHNELVQMWKPVRLQGVGAASSTINANTHPAGKLDAWRARINCLFGLSLNGTPTTGASGANPFDPSGTLQCNSSSLPSATTTNYFVGTSSNPQVDPLPFEAVIGWDASQNGNLAQLLQEPSLMGALEGAGITVLGKGVDYHGQSLYGGGLAGAFPTGTTLLSGSNLSTSAAGLGGYQTGDANSLCHASKTVATNPNPSNFNCNPSSIDGLGITDSSQGGGGIYLHAWAHNLQIANDRINSNAGTLSGGINVGQGEFAPAYVQGGTTNSAPGSCVASGVATNAVSPYCQNLNVNIHNNNISLNSSTGDELFSGTPAGAGAVSICTGADYYKFQYNWICGNLSSGDGGGVGQLGLSYNGDIEHNSILFNQSLNPTIPANGGGLLIMGTPDADPTCGATTDQDCVATPGSVGPSDGVGPNLFVNANLIMGNAAESGSGGGLRLQQINGSDVVAFPTKPSNWWTPTIQNNIIADNVAGWDGAGVSLVDALNTNIINNTVVSNSTTASAGILFTTIGYPIASSEGTNCVIGTETSCPQVAGLVSIQNSTTLSANLPATVTCPANHYQGTTASNGTCRKYSYPQLQNNIFWQNSAYYIGVGALSAQYQQNVVSLYNAFTTTMAPTQPQAIATAAHGAGATITGGTGACVAASYWDIGLRGDMTVNGHESGITLAPSHSIITSTTGYPSTNSATAPNFVSQYCNGSRTPPEFGASGWAVPAGISDATVPNPIFSLQPVATVDEGNNWINLRWGPLSLLNPTTNTVLGNYAPSASFDGTGAGIPVATIHPATDFFGNLRPEPGTETQFDPGAVEFGSTAPVATLNVTGGPLTFTAAVGYPSAAQTLTLHNTGTAQAFGISTAFSNAVFTQSGGTCTTTLNAGATCTITVVFTPTALGTVTGTATIFANVNVTGSPVGLTGTGAAPVISATLTPTTWNIYQAANCPGTGLGALACLLDPAQAFTLTNTGNVPLTGIGQGALGGTATNDANWTVVRLLSTCGPAGNGQLVANTTLAPGATCTVEVQFKPLIAQTAGAKPATISVADLAGTQTSTLNGTDSQVAVVYTNPTLTSTPANTTTKTGTLTVAVPAAAAGPVIFTGNPTIAKTGGTGNGAFTITAGGTCTNGAVVSPGASCTVNVQYVPGTSGTGTVTGRVTIPANVTTGTTSFSAN
jgi:Bacterial Ig domain